MLSRTMRLSRAHFASHGQEKRAQGAHFSVSVWNPPSGKGGCAAVISKKIAKLSVSRHVLKRRIFAVLQPFCTSERAIVIYARAGAGSLPFSDIQTEILDLLAQLKVTE